MKKNVLIGVLSVIVLILLSLLFSKDGNNNYENEIANLQIANEILAQENECLSLSNDSLNKDLEKIIADIDSLNRGLKTNKGTINGLENNKGKISGKLKNLNANEVAKKLMRSTSKPVKVNTYITSKGDTSIQLNNKDAKVILGDLMHCKYNDSLLTAYKVRDSINSQIITSQNNAITNLMLKDDNNKTIISNLNDVVANKDEEIELKDKVIEDQKTEIKKQKTYKTLGIIGGITTTLLVFLAGM